MGKWREERREKVKNKKKKRKERRKVGRKYINIKHTNDVHLVTRNSLPPLLY